MPISSIGRGPTPPSLGCACSGEPAYNSRHRLRQARSIQKLRAPETPRDLSTIAADARLPEELGDTALVVEETKDDPFVSMALAAQATTRLKLGAQCLDDSEALQGPIYPGTRPIGPRTIERRYGMKCSPGKHCDRFGELVTNVEFRFRGPQGPPDVGPSCTRNPMHRSERRARAIVAPIARDGRRANG
jgi:hypothetical protein